MAGSGPFTVTSASPSGGSTVADTLITVRGTGLTRLQRAVYKPRNSIRLITALTDEEATFLLPCRAMGTGIHRLTFTLSGSNVEYASSGGAGLQFICYSEPQFTALRPILGPSWQGSPLVLTNTQIDCSLPTDELYRCPGAPPFDILERMDPFGGSSLGAYDRTRDFGRCRWVCTTSNQYACSDAPIDVYGAIGNVTAGTVTCLVPPEMNGHEGAVEVQIALEGQHFVRPGLQRRNRNRPKIWYYLYPQRVYSRTPTGGPLRGGTRVSILGEGFDGYGKTLDRINQRLLDENLFGIGSVWYYQIPDYTMPGYGQHATGGDARVSMMLNLRCRFGELGDVAVAAISYEGFCFLPAQIGLGAACTENTTVTCVVPTSPSARSVEISVSTNGNDVVAGPHFVPVGGGLGSGISNFKYYTTPTASLLIPPGGPVVGRTSVTVRGTGFAGLGANAQNLQCAFSGAPGVVLSVSAAGDEIVCNTTSTGPSLRVLQVSLNRQDFDAIAPFTFYPRPQIARITPTGGPTLPAYTVTLHGKLFDGMQSLEMPYEPLCQFGALIGSVLSQGRSYKADGVTVEATHAVCTVPTPAIGAAGLVTVRLALNGRDFDDGMPTDPVAYKLATGNDPAPTQYLYYHQQLQGLTPVGGPTGGGTSITVLGSGFLSFDGVAATGMPRFRGSNPRRIHMHTLLQPSPSVVVPLPPCPCSLP